MGLVQCPETAGLMPVRMLGQRDDNACPVDDVGNAVHGIQQRLGFQASGYHAIVPFKSAANLA
jgi:hypothetical protein